MEKITKMKNLFLKWGIFLMFNAITVIGCGLIGSSLLRAIVKNNLANQINTFDKSKSVIAYLSKNF